MKVIYTGRHEELSPKQREKLETKLGKVSKMLDRRGEQKEVHVILSQQRFLHRVEITMNAFDHALIGIAADGDLFTAACAAIEKLEKQVVKMRTKWRDTHRHSISKEQTVATATAPEKQAKRPGKTAAPARRKTSSAGKTSPQVFRVNNRDDRKPMTLEEAMLEMGDAQDYLVYRDAKTDRVSVLMRRDDGHLDLVES